MAFLDAFDFELPESYIIIDDHNRGYIGVGAGPNGENSLKNKYVAGEVKFILKRWPANNTIFIHFYHMGNESFTFKFYDNAGVRQYQKQVDLPALGFIEHEWLWCSFKFITHPDIGGYELKVEGVSVLSEWNIDTLSGNPGIGGVGIYGFEWQLCNAIFADETGDFYNDFMDIPRRMVRLYPDSNGNYSQYTPSSGQNFECVDDFDGDTSYNQDNGVGSMDSFNFDSLPAIENMSVEMMHAETIMRREGTNPAEVSIFSREEEVDTNRSVSNHVLTENYVRYVDTVVDQTQDTSKFRIDNLEIGYKREA